MITEDLAIKVNEIQRLLAEAYEHYFRLSDGYCKSSEGYVGIHLPPFFWREDTDPTPSIEVYAYALGPSRSHYFKNVDEALAEVRKWHASEMADNHDEPDWGDE